MLINTGNDTCCDVSPCAIHVNRFKLHRLPVFVLESLSTLEFKQPSGHFGNCILNSAAELCLYQPFLQYYFLLKLHSNYLAHTRQIYKLSQSYMQMLYLTSTTFIGGDCVTDHRTIVLVWKLISYVFFLLLSFFLFFFVVLFANNDIIIIMGILNSWPILAEYKL